MKRAFGYKRDPESPDDRTFSVDHPDAVALPGSADLRPFVVDVLDQGGLGSCVNNAGMQAIRMSAVREVAASLMQSTVGVVMTLVMALAAAKLRVLLGARLFAYYFARAIDGTTTEDAGTHPRSFFQAVNKLGFPPESEWPYSDDTNSLDPPFKREPPISVLHDAYDQHAPTTYTRIVGDGKAKSAALKKALSQQMPVVFGCNVSQAFCQEDFDGKTPIGPTSDADSVGGHSMVFVGYETVDGVVRFRVLNSWSDTWGDGGYCLVNEAFVEEATDLWIVDHVPVLGGK